MLDDVIAKRYGITLEEVRQMDADDFAGVVGIMAAEKRWDKLEQAKLENETKRKGRR